jgi:hypothetical protein
MELPKWAFQAESRVRGDGAIDLVFRLRPLGRLWLVARAVASLIWTQTITITIEVRNSRPVITHAGELVEPTPDRK